MLAMTPTSRERNVKVMIHVPPAVHAAVRKWAFDSGSTLSAAYARAAREMLGIRGSFAADRNDASEMLPTRASSEPVSRDEFDTLSMMVESLAARISSSPAAGATPRTQPPKSPPSSTRPVTKASRAEALILSALSKAGDWVQGGELDAMVEGHGYRRSLAATAKVALLRSGRAMRKGTRWRLPDPAGTPLPRSGEPPEGRASARRPRSPIRTGS